MPRLLFDENISPRLPSLLGSTYPDSRHVRELGLVGQPDAEIWDRAQDDGYVLVSKDDDFRQLSFLYGAPPKVIWLMVGNAGTGPIAALLERDRPLVERFVADTEESLLVLRLRPGPER